MEVTLISKNNINKLFTVDFDGNVEVLANPFENGGIKEIKNAISLHVKFGFIMPYFRNRLKLFAGNVLFF